MSGTTTQPLSLSPKLESLLHYLIRCSTSPHYLVQRASILLESAKAPSNRQAAQRLHLNRKTVIQWRNRWLEYAERFQQLEIKGASDKELLAYLVQALHDAPRPGAPTVFTAEQLAQIIALACRDPQECERPITHWTARELAQEAIKRGIVKTISPRTVGRLLVRGGQSQTPPQPLLAQPQN